jgi:Na+/H+ antiporter NhaD/arsenite permease-like protein
VSPAGLTLIALVAALVLSMTSRINVGWIAIAAAWLIGVYAAGMKPDAVMAGFPVALFITLTGVTLLFAVAETNGTLPLLAVRLVALARGSATVVPLLFFVLACAISSVGPGAVSTVALLVPLAMRMGASSGIDPLLTSLMVANGANAGNLSPFSSVGVIANQSMARAGLGGHEGRVWFANFAAHVAVAAAAYLWLRRRGLSRQPSVPVGETGERGDWRLAALVAPAGMQRAQLATIAIIAVWIAGVLLFNFSLGLSAFAAAALLLILTRGDEGAAVQRVPWAIVMMVCGVSVLISLLEKTGGMELFTTLLAKGVSASTINGGVALITGAISTYSSTSGVVLPAFLPTVPGLVERVGGGNPLAVALSINVGSSLVDVSPLSTLGALCVAAAPVDAAGSRRLFRALLVWGLSMTLIGALLCQVFANALAR